MINIYPIKLQSNKAFIEEFTACEYGRYEDALIARGEGRADEYGIVVVDFIERWKSIIEVRTDDELVELYYALASGTIGLQYCKHANKLLDKIRYRVKTINPDVVEQWPHSTGV